MNVKINPIISSLIVGPITASALPTTSIPIETSYTPVQRSTSLRKIRFDSAYQTNLSTLQFKDTPIGQPVGELQEQWRFPSDHLPIGMTIDGLEIASWNVLNAAYMSWVTEKNSQGLSRSLIADEHVYLENSALTVRDLHIIELIKSMLEHPTHPRSLISLQECSDAFIQELQNQLPEHYGVILSSDAAVEDQNIIIYDRRVLEYHSEMSQIKSDVFSLQPNRSVMDLCFIRKDNTQQQFRIVNAHLPGEPGNPAPDELAAYLASISSIDTLAIAMGDMNFNEKEMRKAFEKNRPDGFDLNFPSPYCTNVGLDFQSKSIDHFMVFSQGDHDITQNGPEDTLIGLHETVDLLQPAFSICVKNA